MSGRSVETNLACFLNDITPTVFSRVQTDAVYFDCSKAFNHVNHKLLLHKLSVYSLCDVYCSWLESYTSGRANSVSNAHAKSRFFSVPSGVPQGSNIEPLLFYVFVKDIQDVVHHERLLQLADDIKIYNNILTLSDCILLQEDVNAICQWCLDNGLTLHFEKNQCYIFYGQD